jgi:hypothetical protein
LSNLVSFKIAQNKIFFEKAFKHGSGRLLKLKIHPKPNHIFATCDVIIVPKFFGHPKALEFAVAAA